MMRYVSFEEKRKFARLKFAFCGNDKNYLDIVAFIPPTVTPVRNRNARSNETSEEQRQYNERASVNKFKLYIKHNCSDGLFVTFTFGRKVCPVDYDGVTAVMKVYFRRLRSWCLSVGIPLRWLYVVETGVRGGRYHVHAVLNGDVPYDRIKAFWDGDGIGFAHIKPISQSTRDLDDVAGYMAKAPAGKHSYHKSDSMVLPEIEVDDGLLGEDVLMAIAWDADYNPAVVAGVFEQRFPGYCYVCHEGYYSDRLMSPYLHVEMEKIISAEARAQQYVLLSEGQLPYTPSFLRRLEPDQAELLVHGVA